MIELFLNRFGGSLFSDVYSPLENNPNQDINSERVGVDVSMEKADHPMFIEKTRSMKEIAMDALGAGGRCIIRVGFAVKSFYQSPSKIFCSRSSVRNSMEENTDTDIEGIGEYDCEIYQEAVREVETTKRSLPIRTALLSATTLAAAGALHQNEFLVSSGALICLTVLNSIRSYRQLKFLMRLQKYKPSTSTSLLGYQNIVKEKGLPKFGEWRVASGLYLFKDCKEAYQTKLAMIQNAEEEILISGSYCGRKAFKEILDLLEQRMAEKVNLRVFIITETRFVTNRMKFNNWDLLSSLTEKYPNRFFLTLSYGFVQKNVLKDGFLRISNHAKVFITDRKVMVIGGSSLEDR